VFNRRDFLGTLFTCRRKGRGFGVFRRNLWCPSSWLVSRPQEAFERLRGIGRPTPDRHPASFPDKEYVRFPAEYLRQGEVELRLAVRP
jgi:hypothetical protein